MVIRYNGCLLPALILANLFFGRLFFSVKHWLIIEAILVLLLMLSSYIFTRRLFSGAATIRRSNVVDIEGEVVEERQQIKGGPKRG